MIQVEEGLKSIFTLCEKCKRSMAVYLEQLIIHYHPLTDRAKPKEVSSFLNLPPFRASIKDGYAVKSSGGAGVKLVKGYVNAGDPVRFISLENFILKLI